MIAELDTVLKYPDRASVERLQTAKLRALMAAVLPANPFQARKMGGFDPAVLTGNLTSFARLVPFTLKREIVKDQCEYPPYGSNLTFPLAQYVRCHHTSGSTSAPILWLDTQESWSHIVDNWAQIFAAAGVRRDDRFFFAFSFGPFLGFWSAFDAAQRLGNFCVPGGAMSSLARLQAIHKHRVTVLCCTPTYARHLGETAREAGLDPRLSQVRLVIVAGEPGGSLPATRAMIESLWPGSRVFDHHGMTEVGPVSYQCPACPGTLHILESAYYPEIIDPKTGLKTPPGETGELILTTLDRIGSPLLRYRTGDLVKAPISTVCACGRQELACEGGILGRVDDMVIVRGVNVYPGLIEEVIHTYPEISEFRVTLDVRNAMAELSLEAETAVYGYETTPLQKRLEEALESALNLRVPVQLRPPGSLPRFEMKARRWQRIA
jgi:phenylacetate-CoA ligase